MKSVIKKIADIVLMELIKIVMIFSLTIIVAGLLYYELSYRDLFISIVIIYAFLRGMTYNLRCFLYGTLGVTFLVGITMIIGTSTAYLDSLSIKISKYVYVYKTAITEGYLIPVAYQLVIGVGIGLILCLVVMVIENQKHAFIWHMVTGISVIFTAYFVREYYNSDAYFCYIGAAIVYYYHLYYNKKVKKSEEQRFYPLAIHGILFAIILVYLSGFFYEKSPRPLQFINEIGKTIDKYIMQGKSGKRGPGGGVGGDAPGGSTVGYDSSETLKSSVELTDYALLNVYIDNPTYLRGSVCNKFDGREWTYEETDDFMIDNVTEHFAGLIYLANVDRADAEFWKPYFTENEVSVVYRNITTDTLFISDGADYVTGPGGDVVTDDFEYDKGGIAHFENDLTRGFNYRFTYLKPRYDEEALVTLLRKSKKGFYQTLGEQEVRLKLMTHARNVRKNYLDLPDSMTKRTYELAERITQNVTTDFDKAKVLEQYLRTNYDYTYETGLPDTADPVDHFLFEEKEGFCTYNATAMVMLLRMNDIPARFVKGFVVKGSEAEDELSADNEAMNEMMGDTPAPASNLNVITGWDSHAWAEAYFEGYGWLAFEPTSGFQIRNNKEEAQTPIVQLPENVELNEAYDEEAIARAQKRMPIKHALVIIMTFLLLAVTIILFMRWKLKEHKYKISQNRFKFIAGFHKCLLMIKIAGFQKNDQQTIREFAKEVAGALDNEQHKLLMFVAWYEICCYSNRSIPDEWLEAIDAYYIHVRKEAKRKTNHWHVQSALFVYHIK